MKQPTQPSLWCQNSTMLFEMRFHSLLGYTDKAADQAVPHLDRNGKHSDEFLVVWASDLRLCRALRMRKLDRAS